MKLSLLIELTQRDFSERFSGSIMGLGWAFIWPLINIVIYTVIFSKIMSAKLPGSIGDYSYTTYLVSGLIPWLAFSTTILRITTVYLDKKHILTKVNMSFVRLPLFIVFSETITFIITMSLFFVFLWWTNASFSPYLLILPFVYIAQQIFALALGFIAAQLTVFIRDLKEVVGITVQIWFWFTPIVYVVSIIPDYAANLLNFNPVFHFISAYQAVFVYHRLPDINNIIIVTLIGHVLLLCALIMFRYLEKDIRDFL
ncbi:MAG: ABC transporter permease [Gammaproteobacteria bacterium]|nr:ABC transporter permease [Gammaproteobacteria bacterium]